MCCKLMIYNEYRKDSRESGYVRNERNVSVIPQLHHFMWEMYVYNVYAYLPNIDASSINYDFV